MRASVENSRAAACGAVGEGTGQLEAAVMANIHLSTLRGIRVGGAALLLVLAGARAHGEPARSQSSADARACQVAYQSARQKEQSGRLVEASQLFAQCSDETCGVPLWHDCITRSTQLSSAVPSVVPVVFDESGAARVDVKVEMDGQVIASQLNGRSIAIDPGTHQFSFSTPAGVFASQKVTIAKGERNRALAISFPSGRQARMPATVKN
jgi:hypothetical protein